MSRFRFLLTGSAVATVVLAFNVNLQAQSTGRTSTGGTGSTSSSGSSGSSFGGASGASGSSGNAAANSGAGTSLLGAAPTVSSTSTQGTQATQNFIGAGGSGAFVGTGGAGTQARGGQNFGQQFQSQNQNSRRQQQSSQQSRILPRPQLNIGFVYDVPAAPVVQSNLTSTFAGNPLVPLNDSARFPGVSLSVGDTGVVKLTGTVTDDRTRQLAEMLVRLEPGVRSVQNELVIGPSAP